MSRHLRSDATHLSEDNTHTMRTMCSVAMCTTDTSHITNI